MAVVSVAAISLPRSATASVSHLLWPATRTRLYVRASLTQALTISSCLSCQAVVKPKVLMSCPTKWAQCWLGPSIQASRWDTSAGDNQYSAEFRGAVLEERLGSIYTTVPVPVRLKFLANTTTSAAGAPPRITVLFLPEAFWDSSCENFWSVCSRFVPRTSDVVDALQGHLSTWSSPSPFNVTLLSATFHPMTNFDPEFGYFVWRQLSFQSAPAT